MTKNKRASLSVAGSNARARSEIERLKAAEQGGTEEQPASHAMTMLTFRLPSALAEELRGASSVLSALGFRGDQANILRKALEDKLAELCVTYHDGKPFPRRAAGAKDDLPDI